MDIRDHNRRAWNKAVEQGNRWTQPVTPEQIAAARRGEWQIGLTENEPAPADWLGEVAERDVLCLASGGGQQGPILAAAGARVTVFDNSPRQLAQDRLVAEREGLSLTTIEGDMRRLDGLAGFMNPVGYIFDLAASERGEFVVRHKLPYSDMESLTEAERETWIERGEMLEWSHTLTEQIGGQMEAGLVITGFYESNSSDQPIVLTPLSVGSNTLFTCLTV